MSYHLMAVVIGFILAFAYLTGDINIVFVFVFGFAVSVLLGVLQYLDYRE